MYWRCISVVISDWQKYFDLYIVKRETISQYSSLFINHEGDVAVDNVLNSEVKQMNGYYDYQDSQNPIFLGMDFEAVKRHCDKKEKETKDTCGMDVYAQGECGIQGHLELGAWAYILVLDDKWTNYQESGMKSHTTQEEMELTAVYKFLLRARGGTKYTIYVSSEHIVNVMNEKRYELWKMNGWKNFKKQAIPHREMWENILRMISRHKSVSFVHVRRRSNNKWNRIADAYCTLLLDHFEEW